MQTTKYTRVGLQRSSSQGDTAWLYITHGAFIATVRVCVSVCGLAAPTAALFMAGEWEDSYLLILMSGKKKRLLSLIIVKEAQNMISLTEMFL